MERDKEIQEDREGGRQRQTEGDENREKEKEAERERKRERERERNGQKERECSRIILYSNLIFLFDEADISTAILQSSSESTQISGIQKPW